MSEDKTKEEKKEEQKKIDHANIYAAKSAFQGEMEPMEKTKHVQFETNGGRKIEFDYTPLGHMIKVTSPLLSKHGLSARHEMTTENGNQYIEAVLTHETYEEKLEEMETAIENEWPKEEGDTAKTTRNVTKKEKVVKNQIRSGKVKINGGKDMKDTGAGITYARRYTLEMVLGISSSDDNDVQLLEESGKNAVKYAYNRAKKNIEEAKTSDEIEESLDLLKKDLQQLQKGKAPALGLSKEQYEELIEEAKKKQVEIKSDEGDNEDEE